MPWGFTLLLLLLLLLPESAKALANHSPVPMPFFSWLYSYTCTYSISSWACSPGGEPGCSPGGFGDLFVKWHFFSCDSLSDWQLFHPSCSSLSSSPGHHPQCKHFDGHTVNLILEGFLGITGVWNEIGGRFSRRSVTTCGNANSHAVIWKWVVGKWSMQQGLAAVYTGLSSIV